MNLRKEKFLGCYQESFQEDHYPMLENQLGLTILAVFYAPKNSHSPVSLGGNQGDTSGAIHPGTRPCPRATHGDPSLGLGQSGGNG